MKRILGFLVSLPERCMLCVLLAGGVAGGLVASQLGEGMRTMAGRILIAEGVVAGAVAPVLLFMAVAVFFSGRK